jgi:hypothetical protein
VLDSFVGGKSFTFRGTPPHPLKALLAARFAKVPCRIVNARELELTIVITKQLAAFRVLCHEPLRLGNHLLLFC